MKNLIDYAYNDNGTEFRDALYSAIHDKVAAHIDAKKQEIAAGLMGQQFEEEAELDEEFESLDEISVDKIVKYSDKAQKSYADPETSPEKKANRMKGLTTGYQKLKARAKVPATYNEEFDFAGNFVNGIAHGKVEAIDIYDQIKVYNYSQGIQKNKMESPLFEEYFSKTFVSKDALQITGEIAKSGGKAFSGMAFELLITIGIFTVIGIQIDKRIALKLPVATVVMCLFGLAVGFYFIFKQLKKL